MYNSLTILEGGRTRRAEAGPAFSQRMQNYFKDKNVLALYPAEDSGFPMRFDPFRPYFKSLRLLNYARTSHTLGIRGAESEIRRLIAEEKIDILLCCPFASDYQLSVEFFASLRPSVKIIFWFFDDPIHFESYNRYYAQAADAVITTDHCVMSAYRRLEIPAVVCMDLTAGNKYFPVAVEKDIDVSFIGDMRKRGRQEYLDYLLKAGVDARAYGRGSANGYLPAGKISEYFCRSRINLNFSQIGTLDWKNSDEPLLNRVRQNTGRPREVAITGAFCLTEYSPSLDKMFVPGEETDFFRTPEELLEKVRFYLANPGKREAMARAAQARTQKDHLESAYIPRTLGALGDILAAPAPGSWPVYLSFAFKAREVNSRTFSMFVMLKLLRPLAALETFLLLFRHGPLAFLSGFPRGLARAARTALSRTG